MVISPTPITPPPPPAQLTAQQLVFQRMQAADVPDVMAIESVSFGIHHWSGDSFRNELKNNMGRYFALRYHPTPDAASSESPLVGYGGLWMILDEAHITTLAVTPTWRGHSLGELVLLQLLDTCMGHNARWATLEVRASNTGAQALYYKYGFQSMGLRYRYYQDNHEDALIMTTPNLQSDEYQALYVPLRTKLLAKLGGAPSGFGFQTFPYS
jgi:ribosomal-protein-alanine N-acetyltransferase